MEQVKTVNSEQASDEEVKVHTIVDHIKYAAHSVVKGLAAAGIFSKKKKEEEKAPVDEKKQPK